MEPVTALTRGLKDGARYASAHLADWERLGRIARAHTAAEVVAILDATFKQPEGVDDPVAYWSGFNHGVQRVVREAADAPQQEADVNRP